MTQVAGTWQAVREEALRRIRSREWSPDTLIPHEADLAAELGCARATVNRALRALASEGYLVRRRKGGTRVAATPVSKATFAITIIRQDVEARGLAHGYRLLDDGMSAPTDAVKQALKLPGNAPLRRLQALHLADGAPFCLEDRWINPVFAPAGEVRFDSVSANEWLVRNLPYSSGALAFFAQPADAGRAARLCCPEGAALFTVERTTFSDSDPITAVTLSYAPGYRMTTEL